MRRLPLAATAFDRAAHRRRDERWLEQAWERARVVTVSASSRTPATRDADGVPHAVYRAPGDGSAGGRRFLGVAGDVPYFAVTADADEHDEWLTLRDIGPRADDLEAGLLTAAIALEQWHLRHTHCARCGAPTVEANAGWTRTCPRDASEHFPRTDPAVIMLVTDGADSADSADGTDGTDRALLGRGPQWIEGRFSTLAGFVEPGETLEAAVAREVFEEVGVAVGDVRYVASQPWPFPASLMLGFTARATGDVALQLDPVEMAEAGWFTRDEVRQARDWTDDEVPAVPGTRLRAVPPHLSISRFLIDRWLDGA